MIDMSITKTTMIISHLFDISIVRITMIISQLYHRCTEDVDECVQML